MIIGSASEARAAIAAAILGHGRATSTLGDIELHPHQRDGVARVRRLLEVHGGALLADDVGLGKTYVALAIARDARDAIVIAPAALRDTWRAAASRAHAEVRFLSVESLGRRPPITGSADLVIIDEAHHLRTGSTKRFAAAAAFCRSARVLLLTATPVQNGISDLRTILSLFLGTTAFSLEDDELSRFVVRRQADDVPAGPLLDLPRVSPPMWLRPTEDVDCLDRLLALPRAVPVSDGDDGGVLLQFTLLRQWSSSRAALRAALRRRMARAHAMEDALLAGRLPSRAELASWAFADGAQQLAFPELTVTSKVDEAPALLEQVRRHAGSVRDLIAWLDAADDPDLTRAQELRALLQRHRGARIVAFSEYADTVTALYRALAPDARAAMLTHAGGRVAGGPISRREILARFASGASARTPESERIDILLATDVLSEGVNLQDASVVVHLDLAWNPARLEQRVGRLRRMGAARELVHVYLFAPPAPAERLLRLEQRLRFKLAGAARTVGVTGAILPGMALTDSRAASAPREERILTALRTWLCSGTPPATGVAGAVRSAVHGALACIECDGVTSLVAVADGRVVECREAVERLVAAADGGGVPVDPAQLAGTRELIERWLRHRVVSDVVDLPALRMARSRRTLLRRVDIIARQVPRQAQPRLAPLMRAARTAATARLSAGAERVLDVLARSPMSDEAWLHAIGEFAALHARGGPSGAPRLLAVLLLRAD